MKKLMIALGTITAAAVTFAAQVEEKTVQNESSKPEVAEVEEVEEMSDDTPLFEASLSLDINSAYVSHNRIYSDTPVAQYDIWLQMNLPEDFGWIGVDIWANQQLNKRHSSRKRANGGKQFGGFGEFDYEIVYGNSIGPVSFTASHLWYTYPRCGWASQKFWTLGAEYDNPFVVPSVKFFWEYGHNNKPDEAFMIDFALSRSFNITEALTLTLSTGTTLYTSQYAKYISDGELTDTVFGGLDNGISLSYALTDNISLGASLNYLYKIDHRVRHCEVWDSYSAGSTQGTRSGLLYGGFSASISF